MADKDKSVSNDTHNRMVIGVLVIGGWAIALLSTLLFSDAAWVPYILPQLGNGIDGMAAYRNFGGMTVHRCISVVSMCGILAAIGLHIGAIVLAKQTNQNGLRRLAVGMLVIFLIVAVFVLPIGGAIYPDTTVGANGTIFVDRDSGTDTSVPGWSFFRLAY